MTAPERIRVLVTGGRHYADARSVNTALGKLNDSPGIECVIHGGATGADALAAKWAERAGVEVICCPADWALYGKRAGPIRNAAMLANQPDLVVAFDGGRGTADMVDRATAVGVRVVYWRTR